MRKFLKSVVAFTLIIILLGISLNFFLGKYPLEPVHYRLQFDEVNNPRVKANSIVIGTSHAVHAIRPALLNGEEYRFYNFSLNGARPSYYLKWYRELFEPQYPQPEYLILAVDWFMFDEGILWREFEQDSEHFTKEVFMQLLSQSERRERKILLHNRFPVMKYRQRMLDVFKPKRFYQEEYDDGFIPLHLEYKERRFRPKHDPRTVEISESEQQCFQELIHHLKDQKIEIIFVMTPEYKIPAESYQESKAVQFIQAVADQYHIPFINYNTEAHLTPARNQIENFSDRDHMSPQGSIWFSQILANDLKNIMTSESANF